MPHDLQEFLQSDLVSNSARRQSNPDAMVQNLQSLQLTGRHPLAAIPCVLQLDEDSPMAPHMLVVAFEKAGLGVHPADPDNWPPFLIDGKPVWCRRLDTSYLKLDLSV